MAGGSIRFVNSQPQNSVLFLPIQPVYTESISKLNRFIDQPQNPIPFANNLYYQQEQQQNIRNSKPSKITNQQQQQQLPPRRFDSDISTMSFQHEQKKNSFNRRDGWGSVGSGKQSPAISALALLGFLFFLNMIQQSLQNQRYLLTTQSFPSNGTILGSNIALGRSGRVRQKRGLTNRALTPESIPTHPNRQLLFKKFIRSKSSPQNAKTFRKKRIQNQTGTKRGWKQQGMNCLEYAICKLGKMWANEVGSTGRFLMRYMSNPGFTKKNWVGSMFRALSTGWRSKRGCEPILKRCIHNGTAQKRQGAWKKMG